jgi:hypothetical protein
MRQTRLALIGVAVLMAFGVSSAEAAVTCKAFRSLCAEIHQAEIHQKGEYNEHAPAPTSVPEPATLMLLGAGVTAVGAAVARRRKNKKD